ncbi:putative ubiquitin-like 1-activating enzyme e1 a [Rosellinia necatrix]|uniref:Ubiquitin-like 1-activating enzyme E1A n=1 Tax=Rosellinia necatrix TaxID=77044 RepID=A0A1W2TH65_ROSNE|nr:putative ubiquitin-like 1-activating enzyme e1 a [Rosellinia necatrix]
MDAPLDAAPSAPEERPPHVQTQSHTQVQSQPSEPSEPESMAPNGVTSNGVTSASAEDLALVDGPSIVPLPSQGNGFVPQTQDNMFASIDHTTADNGIFPLSAMIPVEPPLPGLDTSHALQFTNNHAMSTDEIALYDRQIRLWGMQAQQKIQAANILLISMRALANEIAKNLVLAGVGSLTILDDQIVTEADLGAQFFLSQENIGQNRAEAATIQAQKLNPRVRVIADPDGVRAKGASYFAAFDIVIATDLNPQILTFINTATRLHNRQFYAAGVHGLYGYIFCDLIEHDYVLKRDKSNVTINVGPESRFRSVIKVERPKEEENTKEMITKRDFYSTWELVSETSLLPGEYTKSKRRLKSVTPALSCLRALWGFQAQHNREPGHNQQDLAWFTRSATHNHNLLSLPLETLRSEFLRSFMQNVNSEVAPVTAILGGQLAQDVINVLGQNQQPIQNMVIFDGNRMEANMYPLHPEDKLGRSQLNSLPAEQAHMDIAHNPTDISHMIPMGPTNTIIPLNPVNGEGWGTVSLPVDGEPKLDYQE